jgi:hypothetical protein
MRYAAEASDGYDLPRARDGAKDRRSLLLSGIKDSAMNELVGGVDVLLSNSG